MKKLIFGFVFILSSLMAFSQGHLENVYVEMVPASAAAIAVDATLAGTTTYRVFVDLADGWQMSGVYGETGNEFYIRTSTTFYNFVDGVFAGRSASTTMFNNLAGKLDSYVTIANFTSGRHGVRYSDDTDGVLDGYMAQTPSNDAMSFTPGFDTQLEATFGPEATGTSAIATFDGAFVDLTGYETTNFGNVIFLGQFTTSGVFSMDLNVQIRNFITGEVEKFTAGTPTFTEINEYRFAGLHFVTPAANTLPSVSITSPLAGNYDTGTMLTVSATASDADGTVASVEFYRNSVIPANKIGDGVDASGTWSLASQWSAVAGTTQLMAVATDNVGGTDTDVISVVVTTPADPAPVLNTLIAPTSAFKDSTYTISGTASDNGTFTVALYITPAGQPQGAAVATFTSSPFSYQWIPDANGAFTIKAEVTDQNNQKDSRSANVNVTTAGDEYYIDNTTAVCYEGDVFVMPIVANYAVAGVIGYDMILNYDENLVRPTGFVYVKNDLLGTVPGLDYTDVSAFVNISESVMNISLAFNSNAPAAAEFKGAKDSVLISVEFVKTASFPAEGTASFSMDEFYESRSTSFDSVDVADGTFTSTVDNEFTGSLKFWKDGDAMRYVFGQNLITNILASDSIDGNFIQADSADQDGKFNVNIATEGKYINIVRQIENNTSVQAIINGADAQLVARVIVNDQGFRPNIYQMMAMDVNRDGSVSAGDLTQIMLRSVKKYEEFTQAVGTVGSMRDWVFVNADNLVDSMYRISIGFPLDDKKGYSRYRVPVEPDAHVITVEGSDCPVIDDETYHGIMYGDVNGSYASAPASPLLKSTVSVKVLFDLGRAIRSEGSIEVPVYLASAKDVTSVDFALQFNAESVSYSSIAKNIAGFESADFFNSDDHTLRFTSYSLKATDPASKFATVRFNTRSAKVNAADLTPVSAMVNGIAAEVAVIGADEISEVSVDVYPNPASDVLNVSVSADAKVLLMDLSGRTVLQEEAVAANQKKELNISGVADGMYVLKVYGSDFSTIKKVVIKK